MSLNVLENAEEPTFALRLGAGLVQLLELTWCGEALCLQAKLKHWRVACNDTPRLEEEEPKTVPLSLTAHSALLYQGKSRA